ncbi:hypothetical protein ACS0TY_009313 [Phlomoides rotata]
MLGKIGWKCFSNPNALISRIFKAKYFPTGNFLNASVGHSPSYAWRSVWSSQDVVMRVQDILVPDTRMWDDILISACFGEEDRRRILQTTVCPRRGSDSLIWHFSDTGEYTVKSAYHMAVNLTLDDVGNSGGVWKKLWALKIPPKVKHWFWRTCRDFLPTKDHLRHKHIPVDSMCVLCGKDRETSWHLFMQCELVLDCWDLSGLLMLLSGCLCGFHYE